MKKNLVVLVVMMWGCGVLLSQETWVKTFGGSAWDEGRSITATEDGGFLLTGLSQSHDGDFSSLNKGASDVVVVKLNQHGDVQWKKTFGGSGYDEGYSIAVTPDGGCLLTGTTPSNDGDFNGMNKHVDGFEKNEIFVIRLDQRGNVQWKRTYGGFCWDVGRSVTSTSDGGCVLTGNIPCSSGDFEGMNKGGDDMFIMKLDRDGDVQWKKTYGGKGGDYSYSITSTRDGGFVLTGETSSNDGDFGGINKSKTGILVIRLDSLGDVMWKKVFGGSNANRGNSISMTSDGGYILTGWTNSNDGDFTGMSKGGQDVIVIKLGSLGDVEWKRLYGGYSREFGSSITQLQNGGFVLTGQTNSNDGDFRGPNNSNFNIFLIKLSENGEVEWKKVLGGNADDESSCITTTTDDGVILTGSTDSNTGTFNRQNKGSKDIFVMKLDSNGNLKPSGKKKSKKK